MSRVLRILHTESSLNFGGQELRILLEMEKMRDLGCESWLAAREGGIILEEAKKRGLPTLALPYRSRLDFLTMWRLAQLMRKEKIDLVNAHGSRDAWNAFLVARALRIPTIRSRHVANPIRRHWLGQLVYRSLADRVVTTSESIRNGLIAAGIDANKIIAVPTGIDLQRFSPMARGGRFRQECGIPSDVSLIGMISVLRGDKGPDLFLEACDRLFEKRPNLWAILVGDGKMRPQLVGQHTLLRHKQRIILAGFRRDTERILSDIDVLVLPSRQPEGVPQVVLQAHAAKVPVVASHVDGVSEVAIDGETAFCCPPNDVDGLMRAIAMALDNRVQAMAQAERGHALVVAKYSERSMLARMAALYWELTHDRRTHG